MHRCSCSTRALEIFVKEFAGISVQRHGLRTLQHQRGFGIRSSSRSPQAISAAATDDAFIPFGISNRRAQQSVPNTEGEGKGGGPRECEEQEALPEDWHPEIEITSPLTAGSPCASVENINEDTFSKRHAATDSGPISRGTVDEVALTGLHPPSGEISADVVSPSLIEPTVSIPQMSRRETRKARKQRRIETGLYKAAAEERNRLEANDAQMQTVLSKLDELDGPSLAKLAKRKARDAFKRREGIDQPEKKENEPEREKAVSKANRLARKKDTWQSQKEALERKFGETGWQPRKRLSPDTLEGIRALHASDSTTYSTEALSQHFKVTPEAIRRILKSRWKPSTEEMEDRRLRWERRGVKKWQDMAETGMRPPVKWRAMGVGTPDGPKEDRVPKRRKKETGLNWDDVMNDVTPEEETSYNNPLAERIL